MATNFKKAARKIFLLGDKNALAAYTKLYLALFTVVILLFLIMRLVRFIEISYGAVVSDAYKSGFHTVVYGLVPLLLYKRLFPELNKDSLSTWTLIYAYLGLFLLMTSPATIKYLVEKGEKERLH